MLETIPCKHFQTNTSRYPEALAERAWDNTGRTSIEDSSPLLSSTKQSTVLLESPFDPLRRQMNSVLLTVDLTKAVADEAIERSDSTIVAYRA